MSTCILCGGDGPLLYSARYPKSGFCLGCAHVGIDRARSEAEARGKEIESLRKELSAARAQMKRDLDWRCNDCGAYLGTAKDSKECPMCSMVLNLRERVGTTEAREMALMRILCLDSPQSVVPAVQALDTAHIQAEKRAGKAQRLAADLQEKLTTACKDRDWLHAQLRDSITDEAIAQHFNGDVPQSTATRGEPILAPVKHTLTAAIEEVMPVLEACAAQILCPQPNRFGDAVKVLKAAAGKGVQA